MAHPNPQPFEPSHGSKPPLLLWLWLFLTVSVLAAVAAMPFRAAPWQVLAWWAFGWGLTNILWWRWTTGMPQSQSMLGYGVIASIAALALYGLLPLLHIALAPVALMLWLSAGALLFWGDSLAPVPGPMGAALAVINALVAALWLGLGGGADSLKGAAPWLLLLTLLMPVFCHAWLGHQMLQTQRLQMADSLQALERECAQLRQAQAEFLSAAAPKDLLTGVDSLPRCMEFIDQLRERNARKVEAFCAVLVEMDPWTVDAVSAAQTSGPSWHEKVQLMLSGLLCTELRAVDRVGRHTAETFLLVLADTTSIQAVWVLHRIRESMRYGQWGAVKASAPGASSVPTLTMSVAQYCAGETAEQLLQRLETALHHALATGHDQIVIAEDLKH